MSTWAQIAAQAGILLAGAALLGVVVGALVTRAFGSRSRAPEAPAPVATAPTPWPEPSEAVAQTTPLTVGHDPLTVGHDPAAVGHDPAAVDHGSAPEARTEPAADTQPSTEPAADTQPPTEPAADTQPPTEPAADTQPPTEPAAGPEPAPQAPVSPADTQPHTPDPTTDIADLTDPQELRERLRRSEERVAALGAELVGLAELKDVEFGRLESGALRVLDETIAANEARMADADRRMAELRAENEQTTIRLAVATAEVERLRNAVAWRDGRLTELAEQLRDAPHRFQPPRA